MLYWMVRRLVVPFLLSAVTQLGFLDNIVPTSGMRGT